MVIITQIIYGFYIQALLYSVNIGEQMESPLLPRSQQEIADRLSIRSSSTKFDPAHIVTFRECFKLSNQAPKYRNKIFILMAAFWIFASFFISMEFYLFKKPIYCEDPLRPQTCCEEGDAICNSQICRLYPTTIKEHILNDNSLTYQFGLFCGTGHEWLRIVLKILPQALSVVGMLIYGSLADRKGRKTAVIISWRMYTFGLIIFAVTQTMLLRILGYVIACVHCYPSLISQITLIFQLNLDKSKSKTSLLLLACLFVGPLILSLTSRHLLSLDTRLMLIGLCAVPAFVLSFLVNKLVESPIFTYPFNKILAFNLINQLAKLNKQPPILIDLSRSHWHRHRIPKESFIALLKNSRLFLKLILGVFFMFTIYLSIKISQISLDPFTDVFFRSVLINVSTALADITLCFFLNWLINKTCRYMFLVNCFLLVAMIFLKNNENQGSQGIKVLYIAIAVLLRYSSELCYGIMLNWAIETFPTINRSYCVGIVISGSSLGVILAYTVREVHLELLFAIALGCSIVVLAVQGLLGINQPRKMVDTYDNKYYDEHDSFYKF